MMLAGALAALAGCLGLVVSLYYVAQLENPGVLWTAASILALTFGVYALRRTR